MKEIRIRKNPVKAIHAFCVECMGGNPKEVEGCTASESSSYGFCPLYPFRMGKNPYRVEGQTEAQKAATLANLAKMHAKRGADPP